jgi:hypothetical protein
LDADPLNRPSANELHVILRDWYYKEDTEFYKQFKEAEEFNKSTTSESNIVSSSYKTHPQAIYTSRLLDYKNLPEPQNSKEINNQFYSGNYFFEITLYLIYLFNSLFTFNIRLFASRFWKAWYKRYLFLFK